MVGNRGTTPPDLESMDSRVASYVALNSHSAYRLPSSLVARYLDSLTSPGHEQRRSRRQPLSLLCFSTATSATSHMDRNPEDFGYKGNDIPRCCCGRPDCAFLAHSCKLLESVKRDARTAGELGQVCCAGLYCSLVHCLAVELRPQIFDQSRHFCQYDFSNFYAAGAACTTRGIRCRR